MKKLSILYLLLLFGLLINCSKNNNDDDAPGLGGIDKSANLLGVGDSANDFLSNNKFSKLSIEIAYVKGFRPTQEAMVNFETYLRDRTFKQDIEVIYKELNSSNEEDLSLQEIADLEDGNRTVYNSGETLAVYIYFADAPSEDDDPDEGLVTLGAVYRNTSMIIYEKTVKQLAGQSVQISDADVETATLNHEFGHLFGLVDLGTAQVNNHLDPNAENHCNVSGCLMSAELQFGSGIISKLESRISKGLMVTPSLDAECILDLQGNGGR